MEFGSASASPARGGVEGWRDAEIAAEMEDTPALPSPPTSEETG